MRQQLVMVLAVLRVVPGNVPPGSVLSCVLLVCAWVLYFSFLRGQGRFLKVLCEQWERGDLLCMLV